MSKRVVPRSQPPGILGFKKPSPRVIWSVLLNLVWGGTGHWPVPAGYQPAGCFGGKLPRRRAGSPFHPFSKQALMILSLHDFTVSGPASHPAAG